MENTSQIRWDRVERLAKLMREVADRDAEKAKNKRQFHIGSWMSFGEQDWTVPKKHVVEKDGRFVLTEGFCGTTACVLGWATTLEEFRKDGLIIRLLLSDEDEKADDLADRQEFSFGGVAIVYECPDDGETYYSVKAGQKFFGFPYFLSMVVFGIASQAYRFYVPEDSVPGRDEDEVKENSQITAEDVARRLEEAVAQKSFGDYTSLRY